MNRAAYLLVVLLASAFLIEITLRAYFATQVGPSVLLYGTPYGQDIGEVEPRPAKRRAADLKQMQENRNFEKEHRDRIAWNPDSELRGRGYRKYRPNQIRIDRNPRTGQRFDVTINGQGFRGEDFQIEKAPGVVRVLTLGASSTFGYFNRDHETYPFVLEQLLNAGCADEGSYEVINLGIPHLRVLSVRRLLEKEGFPLQPDVVTLYSGRNDSRATARQPDGADASPLAALSPYLITVAFVDGILDLRGRELSPDVIDTRAAGISERFVAQVAAIHQRCRERGVDFIVMSQQAKSEAVERARVARMTYDAEVQEIRSALEAGEQLSTTEASFLGHAVMMRDLRAWVDRSQTPFVDIIEDLDHERDVLVSYVHLSPRGNRLIAESLSRVILERTCTRLVAPSAPPPGSTDRSGARAQR